MNRRARKIGNQIFRHVVLSTAAVVMLFPLLWLIMSAFKPDSMIFSHPLALPEKLDFSAFVNGWTELRVSFTTFYKNSFIIAGLAVVGNLMACSLTAFAFARLKFWGRSVWFALMLGTLMLPYHVTLVPQYIMFLKLGWVGSYLPLIVPKFLAVDAFFIFLMVQFFRGIPREIDEAATMDGCGPWRIYWKIMLPLSTPVLATAAIFSFIWTYDDFLGPLIYLNDPRKFTVPLALRAFVDGSGGESLYGELFAMSTLSLVPVFIVFLAFQRLIIRGVALGALKR
ncbi:carbohydrate ABC transporter permease [Frigidibacter sp. ROC022]|uniref:carbohydrate ABC transporter permease n=1 Tax=Frigidibacter sp. ROC022 TaxID=2971796 RepID=UPI00215B1CD6|nr:carbohydrate ABC transporter permease [Frigidibacter sp. ROC022]MCR8725590.1 carbohydrate ABC transporter permease [Frigidibacter sp. ROC022]